MKPTFFLFIALTNFQLAFFKGSEKPARLAPVITAWSSGKNPADLAFREYELVQKALAGDDALLAQKTAVDLLSALKKIPGSETALKSASAISLTKNISVQRKSFAALSLAITSLFKQNKPTGEMIYIDYCPMVKSYWLSSGPGIMNPYLGKSMPTCGKSTGMIM